MYICNNYTYLNINMMLANPHPSESRVLKNVFATLWSHLAYGSVDIYNIDMNVSLSTYQDTYIGEQTHMLLSISDKHGNSMQHHAPLDDPDNYLIICLHCLYVFLHY